MGNCVQYFGYFQGYWIFRKINYGDICQTWGQLHVTDNRKYVHKLLVNRLFKPAQEKVWLGELTVPQWSYEELLSESDDKK